MKPTLEINVALKNNGIYVYINFFIVLSAKSIPEVDSKYYRTSYIYLF